MARFSIVIPTFQRADTLAFAIETALAQTHPDFEIVVQNNGNDQATCDVVASFASPRIVLNGSAGTLPMVDNWEAALAASSGDYVAFIGDDDGVMPDACAICDELMSSRPSLGALHWAPHYYDWPTSLRESARSRLIVNLPGATAGIIYDCRDVLRQLYDGTLGWTTAPLIYNGSFVRRSVIEKVKAFCGGRYFAGHIPDVHSGIANLWAMQQFLHIDRPLSICGASGHSHGNAQFVGSRGMQLQQRFDDENPVLRRKLAEYILDSTNLELTVAAALLMAKEIFFKDDPNVALNMRNVLLRMASGAYRDFASYDRTIAEMRQVARKYGIDPDTFNLPPKQQRQEAAFQGPMTDASGRTTCIAVNGVQAGIRTIADAVRLAASMVPSTTQAQLNDRVPRSAPRSPSRIADELAELTPLMAARPDDELVDRYFRLTDAAIRSRRADVEAQYRILPGQTTKLSLCRIPATPSGRPLALFIPDMLTYLPDAALRALCFLPVFDLAICEWPGHGASGATADPSLSAIAAEYAALIDHALPTGQTIFAIGESVGGLVALALARLRPDHIRNVILIDTPFHLTRPQLVADLTRTWRASGSSPYLRRLVRDVMGFDPVDPRMESECALHALLEHALCNCALIPGSDGAQHDIPSVLSDEDLAALRAVNPALLTTARIAGAGHHVLRDDPQGMLTELNKLLVRG